MIGDTANKISADIRGLAPHISWRQIVNMRNAIVHAYWQVDWETVLNVVSEEIPVLLIALDSLERAIGEET